MSLLRNVASAVTALAVAGALTVGISAAAAAETPPPSPAPVSSGASPAPGSSPQAEIDAYMKQIPGGEQVSDNAVSYRKGKVIVVFPNVGESRAPDGLGSNVRDNAPPLDTSVPASYQQAGLPGAPDSVSTLTYHGCPYSDTSSADWYCFYKDASWGGARWQFQDTCADYASNWGFDNMTTSWANTAQLRVYAEDHAGDPWMWSEGLGETASSNVGSLYNDKLSYWYVVGNGC